MTDYILSIDQGTTSSRAVIFDENAKVIACSQKEVNQIISKKGWIEQNPEEIWETVYQTIKDVINAIGANKSKLSVIGITNQRETSIIWDKNTGKPVYNAIVWQSRQSQYICNELIEKGHMSMIKKKTGLIINAYFSASKIKWIIDNVDNARARAFKGDLLFGTVDTYLIWKLTDGKEHITDYSNASRTMLFNIHSLKWDSDLLEIFGVPKLILPRLVNTSEICAKASRLKEIDNSLNINIAAVAGDQQASLFGHCCLNKGDIKNTYGTGCFMLMNIKDKAIDSSSGLLTTIAWSIKGKIEYALEGSVFMGGSIIQWLRDNLGLIEKAGDTQDLYDRTESCEGVYMIPAFAGLGTPYWVDNVRGAIFGLNKRTRREHIVRACLESIAYQSKDVMEAMKRDSATDFNKIAVDGGASSNDRLMQFQADILDCMIVRPRYLETTALGAAYLAGLSAGIFTIEDIIRKHTVDRIFVNRISKEERNKLYSGWLNAVKATQHFKPDI